MLALLHSGSPRFRPVSTPFFDAFISYAHDDAAAARWLFEELSGRGLSVFLDQAVLRYGDNVPARIERSLERSLALLFLVSHRSLASAWVGFESSFDWEATFIHGRRKLIPVIIEAGCSLPARLKNLRACDLSGKDGQRLDALVTDLLEPRHVDLGPLDVRRDQPDAKEFAEEIVRCVGRYEPGAQSQLTVVGAVIDELVDNVFRHTSSPLATVSVRTRNDAIEVTVHDAGQGFDLQTTLRQCQHSLDEQPLMLGGRGLVLLESRSVMLSNGTGDDGRHWIMATVWLATDSWITLSPNGCRTVRPMGRLDHGKVKRFEATLMPLVHDSSTRGIVLDLSDVEYISSVSLRAMMIAKRAARQRGISLVAVALQPVVAEQFHISRFDKVVPIFETRDQAEAAIGEELPLSQR